MAIFESHFVISRSSGHA